MRTNKFLAAVLLVGVAFSALTSCQKDDPQPNYQSMEGVQAITFEKMIDLAGSWSMKESTIFFYSDSFPILSLDGSTITIHSEPQNSLLFYYCQVDSTSQTAVLPYEHVTSLDSLK